MLLWFLKYIKMILFFIKDDIKNIDIEINQYSIINLLSDLERLSKICVFFSTIYFYKDMIFLMMKKIVKDG